MTETRKDFIASAVLSEAIIRGLTGAQEHWARVAVNDESALMSFLATIARLEQYRIILIQAMHETTRKPVEELVALAQKVGDGVVFHNVVSDVLTKEEAASYLGNPQLQDVLSSAVEMAKKKAGGSGVHNAMQNVTDYLIKKRAEASP